MKILLFSDPQIHPFNQFARSRSSMTYLLKECVESLKWVAKTIVTERPDLVVCAGDISENSDSLGVYELNVIVEGFSEVRKSCSSIGVEFWKILGNHDVFMDNENEVVHIVPFLDSVVVKPEVRLIDEVAIMLVPYQRNMESTIKFLDGVKGTYKFGIVHLDINTVPYITGRLTKNAIEPEMFTATTFNGHYHHPSQVGHVVMIGSLRHMNFNDKVGGEIPPRGLLIYDIEKNEYIRHENPHTSHYYTFEIFDQTRIKICHDQMIDPSRSFVRINCSPDLADECCDVFSDVKAKRIIPSGKSRGDVDGITKTISSFDHFKIVEEYIKNNAIEGLDIDWIVNESHDIIKGVTLGS